jgi:hypothetical protein
MNDELTNDLNMIKATAQYADNNPAPTAGVPAFNTRLTLVKGKIVIVDGLGAIISGNTKGVTTDTNLLRSTMESLAFKCAKGTLAYANVVNNNTLKEKVNYSEDRLRKEKKEVIGDVCQKIHDAADANSAAVADYGVDATDISDLQAAINVYRAASQDPRNERVTISQAGHQAQQMVRGIVSKDFKEVMDPIVDTLKAGNRPYWDGWKQIREKIDLGHTTAKVRGTVLNESDNSFIKNALFKIFETGTATLVRQTLTDSKGNFNAPGLPSGNFDFKWEKTGWEPKTEENVHIGPGKELKRKVTLKLIPKSKVFEGDVFAPGFLSVATTGLNTTPATMVELELSGPLRIYGATVANMPPGPGQPFWDANAGSDTKELDEFVTLTGADGKPYLSFQNNGVTQAHFKVTFTNVE